MHLHVKITETSNLNIGESLLTLLFTVHIASLAYNLR